MTEETAPPPAASPTAPPPRDAGRRAWLLSIGMGMLAGGGAVLLLGALWVMIGR